MAHHRVGLTRELRAEGLDEPTVVAFLDALEPAARGEQPWPPRATTRERALLDYALALTRAPSQMTADHIRPMPMPMPPPPTSQSPSESHSSR